MLLKFHSLHKFVMGDFFMKNDLTVAGVYIAALIGAGFSSGSEIVHYFAVYGKWGILGIVISSVLFGVFAAGVLAVSKRCNVKSYGEFLEATFPGRVSGVVNSITLIFMFVVFVAMASGSGETFTKLFGINKIFGVMLILTITFFVLLFDVRGLIAANGVMAALIIAGTLGVVFFIFLRREIPVFSRMGESVISGGLYTGYNILTGVAVLPALSAYIKRPVRVGVFSTAAIFILLTVLWGIISIYYGKIPLGALPMLTICQRHGSVISGFYTVILFMAMLTTAIANAFSVTDAVGKNRMLALTGLVVSGFFLAGFPFDFFVGRLYRVAGLIGVIFGLFILLKIFQKK